jgi:putative spermidine/putrescine transport system substrate-binding protein
VALLSGGPVQALRQIYVAPFVAAGTPVQVAMRQPGPDGLRADVLKTDVLKTGGAAWDVAQVTAATLAASCQAGLVEKLDWSSLGGRDRMLAQGATECGLGAFARATVLSWDREKFPATPNWQDFWDIAKVPGKRGLHRSPRGTLEIALLADGVAPADIYRTLRTDDGIERAFRRLDQLAPYVVWWNTGDRDAVRLLSSGEVLMTAAPSAAVALANRAGPRRFGLQWAGGLIEVEYWAIVKGAARPHEAERFLAAAADPKLQARLPELAALGGLAKGANDGLSPELLAVSPTANLGGALFIDEAFWRDNGDKLGTRFNAALAH